VRLHEIAPRFELRHLVADRRRAHAEVVLLSERDRADRLRRVDVFVHDGCEDEGFALVEFGLVDH